MVSEHGEKRVASWPHLVVREAAVGLFVIAVLILISVFVGIERLPEADPSNTEAAAKAPWFFVGVQELLYHLPVAFASVAFPLITVLFLLFMPYLSYKRLELGDLGRIGTVLWGLVWFAVAAAFIFLSVVPFYSQAVLTVTFALFTAAFALAGGRLARMSVVESLFGYLLLSYALWTVLGVFFRTDQWAFTTPF